MVKKDYSEHEEEINAQIIRISRKLREEREKQKISQMDLSFKAGLSQNQVNYIENGKRIPNLHTLLSLCNAMHISPAALFELDTSQNRERQKARKMVIHLVSRFM
ncbi:MAG: helix-turn-helix transcriptional regulator [Treponema sp.]|nr:helix-turn-helix transcriptional regulator [Treponema sp.]